jgi:deoxyribonucleoside regulator
MNALDGARIVCYDASRKCSLRSRMCTSQAEMLPMFTDVSAYDTSWPNTHESAHGGPMDGERMTLLAQVASWYYEENLSQEAIAQRVGRSRSMVSRMLQEARELGLVSIQVHFPLRSDVELAQRLCHTFGLTEAHVLADAPTDYDMLLKQLGELGARCLQRKLHDGVAIGMSWGTALYQVVRAMPEMPLHAVSIVQFIGAVGHGDPMVDGLELARWLAQKLGASLRTMRAPLMVESEAVAAGLLQDRAITEVLTLACQVEVALVGVGTTEPPRLSSLWRPGYLTESDLLHICQAGIVGDILGRPLDADGRWVHTTFDRRVIGVDLETLKAIPTVIAVAGGLAKTHAILAALRGGYLDVLVTDAKTAAAVLALV